MMMSRVFLFTSCLFAGFAAVLSFRVARRCSTARAGRWLSRESERLTAAFDLPGSETAPPAAPRWLAPIGLPLRFILGIVRKRRIARAAAQLPDVLALLRNALKSGLALAQGLEMAPFETPPPLGPELARAVRELKLGRTLEEALGSLAQRVPDDDVQLMVQSVEVLRRTGGNLIETFESLASTIEERRRVEERIGALTAQGLFQGLTLLAMPWGLGLALAIIAPEYIAPLVTTRPGLMLVAAGVILEAAGAAWLKKIVVVRV